MTKTIATPPTAEAGQRPRLLDETLMTIPEAAKLFPGAKGSKAIYAATVYRWARIGVRGRRLETIRVGSLVRTSREAIEPGRSSGSRPGDGAIASPRLGRLIARSQTMFIAFLIVAGGLLIAALITFEFANAPLIEEPIE